MSVTYTKLKSGEWGIRAEGTLQEGQTVTVRKKSGETKTETVKKIVFTGNGITLAAVISNGGGSSGGNGYAHDDSGRRYRKSSRKCKAHGCGQDATDRGYCARCAFDEFDDRSSTPRAGRCTLGPSPSGRACGMDVLGTILDLSEQRLRDEVDGEFEGRCWLNVAGIQFTTEDVQALRDLQEARGHD